MFHSGGLRHALEVVVRLFLAGGTRLEVGVSAVIRLGDRVGEALRHMHAQVELTVLDEVGGARTRPDPGQVIAVGNGERRVVRGDGDRGGIGRATGSVDGHHVDDDLVRRWRRPPTRRRRRNKGKGQADCSHHIEHGILSDTS